MNDDDYVKWIKRQAMFKQPLSIARAIKKDLRDRGLAPPARKRKAKAKKGKK